MRSAALHKYYEDAWRGLGDGEPAARQPNDLAGDRVHVFLPSWNSPHFWLKITTIPRRGKNIAPLTVVADDKTYLYQAISSPFAVELMVDIDNWTRRRRTQ